MDIAGIVSLVIGVLGVSGVIFTALRWRRDDTTAVLAQQDTIVHEITTLNTELRVQRDEERARNAELRGEVNALQRQLSESRAEMTGKMRKIDDGAA